jgi:hypothetical protein
MALFRRRPHESASGPDREPRPGADAVQVPGLAAAAGTRGWQRVTAEVPIDSQLAAQVHQLAWILHGVQFSSDQLDATSVEHRTIYRQVWAGTADPHRFVVANAWTDIGPRLTKFHDYQAISVCVVDRCTLPPFLVVQRHLPWPDRRVLPEATGDPGFDGRLSAAFPLPGTGEALLTAEVRRRLLAHDDWAFVSMSGSLLCAGIGPFGTVDSVTARVDEVLGLVAAFAGSVAPPASDPAAGLIARFGRITSLEEAGTVLVGLSPSDRAALARSGTPLAAFADVRTQEQALQRFLSLSLTEKMRLYALMQITE